MGWARGGGWSVHREGSLRLHVQQLDVRGQKRADREGGLKGWRHPQFEMLLLPGSSGAMVGITQEPHTSLQPHSQLPATRWPPCAHVGVVVIPISKGYWEDSVKLCIKP